MMSHNNDFAAVLRLRRFYCQAAETALPCVYPSDAVRILACGTDRHSSNLDRFLNAHSDKASTIS